MAHELSVRQVNASFQAHFAETAFDLFKDLPGLLKQLFARLGPLGLSLADVKFEAGTDSLGEAHLRCYLFDLRTTLRVYLDRVDLTSNVPAGVSLAHEAAAVEAVGAVTEHMPGLGLRAYTAVIGCHGVPAGISAADFLTRFTAAAPRRTAPLLGAGTVFYYGAAIDQLASSVTLDLSRVVEGGLFVQARAIYDAEQVPLEAVTVAARKFLLETMAELGLELKALFEG